ncbi:MAG: T9SS type A sorting domain-containing protein [Saprospiraceae bacterium]|nr:T9SS type A sorting domain-containing protein [Saprospiraceae bacterium]
MVGTVTVKSPVVVDLYPLRTIAQLKGVNADGVADSLGVKCTIKGVVYGINFRPAGLQFTIIDAQNKGLGVFNSNNNLGYSVKEGDEVQVKGTVAQFRGLSQLTADSLKVLSTGNTLVTPKVLTNLSENDESSYVQIKNVSFADPTQWTGTGSGFNMTMTDGTNNFTVRVANVTDAYALSLPSGTTFNVTGILTQFAATTSAPFADGYQIQPNYYTDFVATSASKDIELDAALSVSPNPVSNVLTISTSAQPEILEVYNTNGQLINKSPFTNTIDFSNFNGGIYIIKVIKGEKSSSVKIVKM